MRTADKLQFVHSDLREKVINGIWKSGDRLPTTNELAKSFDCSVGIISKAIAVLVREGLVEQRSRLGTRVLEQASHPEAQKAQIDACAFIFPSSQHEGIWRTVKGFQAAAHDVQRKMVMITTGTDLKKEVECIRRLSEFDVKGAAFYPVAEAIQDQILLVQALADAKLPVILSCVGAGMAGLTVPAVYPDDFHAGYTTTKYLLEKGLKRIGFLGSRLGAVAFRGYKWAFEEAGVAFDPAVVDLRQNMHDDYEDSLREPTLIAEEYLKSHSGLEAVACGFDFLAHGVIRAAAKLGIKIPDDLKVVGTDDFQILSEIPLTTYRIPYERIGRRSFEVLNELILGRAPGILEEHLKGELVIRQSA